MWAYHRRLWWAVRPLWLWRALRLLLRGLWLAAALSAAGWLAGSAAGWQLSLMDWVVLASPVIIIALTIGAGWPVAAQRLSRRLDRAMSFKEQLVTAEEVSRRQAPNDLEQALLIDADRLLVGARHSLARRPNVPWGDIELVVLAAAMLYACALYAQRPAPPTAPVLQEANYLPIAAPVKEATVSLPGLADSQAPFVPAEAQQEMAAALDPYAAQRALDSLTEAFGQNDATGPASTALQHGDTAGAAESLRALADSAGQLSPEMRQQLANSLDKAAADNQAAAPQAAEAMSEAASNISQSSGTPQEQAAAAAGALETLARLIEALGQARDGSGALDDPTPQEDGDLTAGGDQAGFGSTAGREEGPSLYTSRLDAAGATMELPEGEASSASSGMLQPPTNGQQAGGPPQSSTYSQLGAIGSGGGPATDPLRNPWRWRHVVQRYFSPP